MGCEAQIIDFQEFKAKREAVVVSAPSVMQYPQPVLTYFNGVWFWAVIL